MSQGINLDEGRELSVLNQINPFLGSAFRKVVAAINNMAKNASVSPTGELPAPPPVDSTQVKGSYNATTNTLTAPGEILHWVHTHNAPINRGIQYVTEIDTAPSFPQPHQLDKGSSRSGFDHIPAFDDNGNLVKYYLRVTPQYAGSGPQTPTVFGGKTNPIAIVMTGATNMSLLPSQGGGTAFPQQGGQGLGKVQSRGSATPAKRQQVQT